MNIFEEVLNIFLFNDPRGNDLGNFTNSNRLFMKLMDSFERVEFSFYHRDVFADCVHKVCKVN